MVSNNYVLCWLVDFDKSTISILAKVDNKGNAPEHKIKADIIEQKEVTQPSYHVIFVFIYLDIYFSLNLFMLHVTFHKMIIDCL